MHACSLGSLHKPGLHLQMNRSYTLWASSGTEQSVRVESEEEDALDGEMVLRIPSKALKPPAVPPDSQVLLSP